MAQSPKKTCSVRFEPSGLKAQVDEGTILLEAARTAGVYLTNICGGDGYCGKCKVVVDRGQTQSRPTTLLTADEIRQNMVLACQTKILSDITVTVPKSHVLGADQILMDFDDDRFSKLPSEIKEAPFVYDPLVRKLYLEMSEPTVTDHCADYERLHLAIREQVSAP